MLTFGGHLEVLRRMLVRILCVVIVIAIVIFCFKEEIFKLLLSPRNCDFYTFRFVESILKFFNCNFQFPDCQIPLISTELSAQFMTHITVSCIISILLASPYILFELFRFISPALYDNEKRYSLLAVCIIYLLFLLGVLMSYFVLFPISFQFLANYQVNDEVVNTITLDSYISTFSTLTFVMGVVFQLPVISFFLGKIRLIDALTLKKYRSYAIVIIMLIAAIITPPDLFTLILVALPIYGLYEISILILMKTSHKTSD